MDKQITTRELALKWWNNLTLEEKFYKVIPWLSDKGINVTERHPDTLTGREIEEIWSKETKINGLEVSKTIVDESLLGKAISGMTALSRKPNHSNKELFELEQELDIPSNLRFHNSQPTIDNNAIEAAKKYINLPLDKEMDEEERYFNSKHKEYDAFLAGVAYQKLKTQK